MTTRPATFVLTPRETVSGAADGLARLLPTVPSDWPVVVVDAGYPTAVRRRIDAIAARRPMRIIREDQFLSPNRARNIALEAVDTPWIVFADNDVSAPPGWAEALVAAGERQGADVVGPTVMAHGSVHWAGGTIDLVDRERGTHCIETVVGKNHALADLDVTGGRAGEVEFHAFACVVETVRHHGGFDEGFVSDRDHTDFCLRVTRDGGLVWHEPASVVEYLPPPRPTLRDRACVAHRWEPARQIASLMHFARAWGAAPDDPSWDRHLSWAEQHRQRLMFGPAQRWLDRAERHLRVPVLTWADRAAVRLLALHPAARD